MSYAPSRYRPPRLRQMLSETSPRGVLVTVGSVMGDLPAARQAEYCASKAALTQLHESLRTIADPSEHEDGLPCAVSMIEANFGLLQDQQRGVCRDVLKLAAPGLPLHPTLCKGPLLFFWGYEVISDT